MAVIATYFTILRMSIMDSPPPSKDTDGQTGSIRKIRQSVVYKKPPFFSLLKNF
jgi:hypothetical protein